MFNNCSTHPKSQQGIDNILIYDNIFTVGNSTFTSKGA